MLNTRLLLLSLAVTCPLWAIAFWYFHTPPLETLALARWMVFCLMGCVALIAACIDVQTQMLPDSCTLWCALPCVAAAAALNVMGGHDHGTAMMAALPPLTGAFLGFCLLKLLQIVLRRQTGREQLGSGDAKLMLGLGALTGPTGILPTLFLAVLLVWPIFKLLRAQRLPFGPSLVTAAIVVVLFNIQWPTP